MRIKSPKDLGAGFLFLVLGGGFAALAPGYSLGTPARIGPGFFPFLLGLILAGLGLVILARAVAVNGEPLPATDVRPLGKLLLAMCLFGVLLRPLGLVGSIVVLVLVGGWAGRDFRLKEAVLLAAGLAIASAILFVQGLGVPLPLWPKL
ncbi:MAG: rane protein [Enterovirga sp.]|jgi:hypothetical protein|nr:rane protein [Enterovirga sp.]